MKKFAYLDCPTGIAGDMCLGALVDAGVPLEYLVEQLNRLSIAEEYQLTQERVQKNGQQAVKIHVTLLKDPNPLPTEEGTDPHHTFHTHTNLGEGHPAEDLPTPHSHSHTHSEPHSHNSHRHLSEIERMILGAGLPTRAEAWSLAVFRTLAVAEGAVHGIPPEQVHFHEVGAMDAIVDIVGTCLGIDWLGIDELHCSALPTGGGTIRAAHGRLPVPAPAVLKLWEMRQIPIYHNGIDRELVTPTGAAIVTTLATRFGPPPPMTLQRVGLGAGSRNLEIPNVLRLWLGEGEGRGQRAEGRGQEVENAHVHSPHLPIPPSPHALQETIAVLETQIDDLNPQAIGYLYDALFAVGAVDVFTQPIGMKKSRPGVLLTVICHPEKRSACEQLIFQETSTLGIRHFEQQRTILEREIKSIETEYGPIRVKVAWEGKNGDRAIRNVQPEYEDCAQIARTHHIPWRDVHQMALQHWYESNK
ncbi:MAG: nickel pincer cofactor biosynthesis protein LarC [Leptolyngbyaceae cyanobacterium bins.59]|nr:nickel pincer cofactor biosynthesis protein LarC [Leptolyngbyaceae cyanobacterium bins.59]